MSDESREHVHEAEAVAQRCAQVLAGRPPSVQGAALGDLVATWLRGHHPASLRGVLLEQWVQLVRDLVAMDEPRPH